ncbi:UBX domain-containing protein [Mycena kentingensis (nom. inval.)]|nr:UBX domain-containing protein [Mycena kentingensis (nom. inval.)]
MSEPAAPAQSLPKPAPEPSPEQAPTQPTAPPEPTFKVYRPSSSANARPLPPLTDEDLTPTAADLKAAQTALSARTQALVDAPLQLRSTREAAEKAKRDRWPNTTIRIRFTDGTILQKVFPSTSKIRVVYAFVREALREETKPVKFVLYQPPKRDLKVSDPTVRDRSLAELNLAPASVLLLRFEDVAHPDKVRALNASGASAPLSPNVLAQAIDLPSSPRADFRPSAVTGTLNDRSDTRGRRKERVRVDGEEDTKVVQDG